MTDEETAITALLSLGLVLLNVLATIAFWIYCHIKARKHELPRKWYMWVTGFILAGWFGLLLYAWYWRRAK